MKILTVLTYYRPHTSGLTIYAERLAKALVALGHDVTILTMKYDPSLASFCELEGVKVHRVNVAFRVSKGVTAPSFGFWATKYVLDCDAVHLHLPQFDAAGVALRAKFLKKPCIITYHCDLDLPKSSFNLIVGSVVNLLNNCAAKFSDKVVTYTNDYGNNSRFLKKYQSKQDVILPPVELPEVTQEEVDAFATIVNPLKKRPLIGMAARFASEKGVEVLLEALPEIIQHYPEAAIVFAGQYQDVMGELDYYNRLKPQIDRLILENRWRFLGVLTPKQMALLYRHLDLLVVPSLNSTESFGLVQVEAMQNGVPVVAADLPGVRQPVQISGMGRIAQVGSSSALAEQCLAVLRGEYVAKMSPEELKDHFSPARCAESYLRLFSPDLYK